MKVYALTVYPVQMSDINGVYSTHLNALEALAKHTERMGDEWSIFHCVHHDEYGSRYEFMCLGVQCYADICAHEIDEI